MLNLKIQSEKGITPQFAGAKLHLICQITKLLAFFFSKSLILEELEHLFT